VNASDQLPDLSLDQLVELQRRADDEHPTDDDGDDHGDGDGGGDDDGTLVLPWWQHPFNIAVLVVSAALIAGILGWMVGDSGGRVAHSQVDTGFLQDMRLHHEQAVYMSQVYLEDPDINPGMAAVAGSIITGQTLEVGRMIQLLRDFDEPEALDLTKPSMAWMGTPVPGNEMPGMATETQLDQLSALSGSQADQLFATLMIAHHEGGVHMAEYASEQAKSPEVRSFAESIIRSQQSEIAEINGQLD
jgi:uncharacterized protein (DUF305 family)